MTMPYNHKGPSPKLNNRRLEFYTRYTQGEKVCDIVRALSGKYHVAEPTLRNDWHKRDTWGLVLREPEEEFVVQDYLQEVGEVVEGLWREALGAAVPSDRIAAFKAIADIIFRKLKASQELGRVHKEPLRIAIEQDIDKLHEAVVRVAGGDIKAEKDLVRVLMEYQHNVLGNSEN
jgi:hypothetical protein